MDAPLVRYGPSNSPNDRRTGSRSDDELMAIAMGAEPVNVQANSLLGIGKAKQSPASGSPASANERSKTLKTPF